MLYVVDSFVEYLASELSGELAVHLVRVSANDPQSARLVHDDLNVSVLGFNVLSSTGSAMVSLDLIMADERTALESAARVIQVMSQTFYTDALDYTETPPAVMGGRVSWLRKDCAFQVVRADERQCHLSATVTLRYLPVLM